jgi:hypothetical protein
MATSRIRRRKLAPPIAFCRPLTVHLLSLGRRVPTVEDRRQCVGRNSHHDKTNGVGRDQRGSRCPHHERLLRIRHDLGLVDFQLNAQDREHAGAFSREYETGNHDFAVVKQFPPGKRPGNRIQAAWRHS